VTPFAGYVLDLDGTVYLGERLIPGTGEAIAAFRARGARVVFLSNKPIQTRGHYAAKLNRLGVPVATLYVVGEEPLLDELRWAGFHVVEDPSATDARRRPGPARLRAGELGATGRGIAPYRSRWMSTLSSK